MIRADSKQRLAVFGSRVGGLNTTTATRRRFITAAICAAILSAAWLMIGHAAAAQNSQASETFKARLSPVPIDVTMMSTIAGSGSLTAVLAGNKLTLKGTFEGLRSPATTAQIRRGSKGIRGPAILDVTVTKSEKGEISGSFELTPEQITDLKSGRWYVQIQSEKAPDGNLWGWLLH